MFVRRKGERVDGNGFKDRYTHTYIYAHARMNKTMLLSDVNDRDKTILKTTKFASIYRVKDRYVIKAISTDFIIPPHNYNREIYILEQLNLKQRETGVHYCIELFEHRVVPANDEVELLFPWYQCTLHDFMRKQHSRVESASGTKLKFNPYYDATIGGNDNDDGARGDQCENLDRGQVRYSNHFDVDRYALNFLQQISSALQFLHENGIIHRDLKPENIVMEVGSHCEDEYKLVLIDFGISYSNDYKGDNNGETWEAKITDVSTSVYKAPELLFGVQNYGYKIDIWSLMVLASQWFQLETTCAASSAVSPLHMAAVVDDGINEMENGSDIRLIMSIFEAFGVPKIDQWEDVKNFGSAEAFTSVFGSGGDGKYILDLAPDEQHTRILKLFPKLDEIKDDRIRSKLVECILGMVSYDSASRWSSDQLVGTLKD